ncbi:MAG: hypothetical protein LBJ94_00285 [Puniceicoccales bacterium]|jgi:hypothetical protein|nr:hypothetical protein [Puniceicoccales bacterium]
MLPINSNHLVKLNARVKSFWNRISKLVLISFLISSLLHARSEIVPIAPARGLYLPIFDVDGRKVWEIAGLSGEIQEDGSIAVLNMLITRCGESSDAIFTIESAYANLIPAENLAMGDGVVAVSGKNFTALAKGWKFFGGERRFVADGDVRVVFDGDGAEFVAP